MFHISIKFCENILNFFQSSAADTICDGQTGNNHSGKTNVSPEGGAQWAHDVGSTLKLG